MKALNESGPKSGAMNQLHWPASGEASSAQAPPAVQVEAGRPWPAHESAAPSRRARPHAPTTLEGPLNQLHQHQHQRQHALLVPPDIGDEQNTVFQELRMIQSTMQSNLWPPQLEPSASASSNLNLNAEQRSLSSSEERTVGEHMQATGEQLNAAAASGSAQDVRFVLSGDEDESASPSPSPQSVPVPPSSAAHQQRQHQPHAHFASAADAEGETVPLLIPMTTSESHTEPLSVSPVSTITTSPSSVSCLTPTPSHLEQQLVRGSMSAASSDSGSNVVRQQQLASKFQVIRVASNNSPLPAAQSGGSNSNSTVPSQSPRQQKPEQPPNSWQWDFGSGQASGPTKFTDNTEI